MDAISFIRKQVGAVERAGLWFPICIWEQAQVIVEIYNGKFEQGWLSLLFKKRTEVSECFE